MSAPKYSLALVTGASLGIGQGVALRLAREGVKVEKKVTKLFCTQS